MQDEVENRRKEDIDFSMREELRKRKIRLEKHEIRMKKEEEEKKKEQAEF